MEKEEKTLQDFVNSNDPCVLNVEELMNVTGGSAWDDLPHEVCVFFFNY